MDDLRFDVETPPTAAQRLMVVLPRVAFALVFILIGASKLNSSGLWVRVFERIGFGQWFRYLAGSMQLAGGALMLVPRTVIPGALLIACTMAGAAVADVFYLNAGPAFVVPLALLAGSIAFAWQRWAA